MVEELTSAEQSFFKNHGLVILKPDALELFLENMFIQDLENLGLMTRYRQLVKFCPQDVAFIYPEWISNENKFKAIVDNMTCGPSMILLLEHREASGDDLHHFIDQQKGHADQPGLRSKYIYLFKDQLKQLYPFEADFMRELNKNRIHSPDNALQALNTIMYLWGLLDSDKIMQTFPDLYGIITTRMALEKVYAT